MKAFDFVFPGERQLGLMAAAFAMLLLLAVVVPALADKAPTVTSITPNAGVAGQTVNISDLAGTGFTAGATVKLRRSDGAEIAATAASVVTTRTITCTFSLTGTAAGVWDVVVTNSDAKFGTLTNGFTVTNPPPSVTNINPNTGVTGQTVSITDLAGTGFLAGATVKLKKSGQGDIVATGVTVVSATSITCSLNLAGKAAGAWDVVVANTDGQSGTLPGAFTVLQADAITGPTVTDITRTTAIVRWSTLLPSSSNVGYGTAPCASYAAYPNHTFGADGLTDHVVTLVGLAPNTTYYLCVQSASTGQTVESGTISFTTLLTALQPSLAYTGATTGSSAVGEMVTLAATLTQGGVGLSGKAVGIVCENYAATVTTGGNGVASVQVPGARLGTGAHVVSCRFIGDDNYSAAAATGSLNLAGVPGSTILRGTGYFYKGGDRSKRCTFSFRFNVDLVAGWLIFNEAGIRKWISVNVVKTITVNGPEATIVCGPQDQYTLVVNADTEAISMTEGTYSASTSRANGRIVLEEETAE